MKRKFRCVAFLLVAAMLMSFSGCSNGGQGGNVAGAIDKVKLQDIEGFNEKYLPDVSGITQQEGQIDVVLIFDGTEKGWQALADEYMRIQGGYVNVKLDTTISSKVAPYLYFFDAGWRNRFLYPAIKE